MRLSTIELDGSEVAAVEIAGQGLVPVPAIAPDLPGTVFGLIEVGLGAPLCQELTARAAEGDSVHALPLEAVRYGPLCRRPPLFLGDIISPGLAGRARVEDGDIAMCRIPGIGTLSNSVVRREPADGASADGAGDPSMQSNH